MKKLFKFEQKIPATIFQYFEVEAETEEEALAMVQEGCGFKNSFTDSNEDGDYELYDTEDLPENDPEFDSAGFSIADRFKDTEEDTHHCDDPGCNCSL
jgi:hypothetical protein